MAKKKKKMTTSSVKNPFQVIDALFEMDKTKNRWGTYDKTKKQYKTITDKDKQRNFFVINRRLAIRYPLQAFKLSLSGVNPIYAVDSWYMITSKIAEKIKKMPSWLWLKTVKSKKEKSLKISQIAKDFYIKLNQISEKDFETALKYEPDKMMDYLRIIEKQLKILEKNKKN